MELELKNKVAIVTGRLGNGESHCPRFAEEGRQVVISEPRRGARKRRIQRSEGKGWQALFAKVDVANWEMVKQAVVIS